jgi:hypothetical protein
VHPHGDRLLGRFIRDVDLQLPFVGPPGLLSQAAEKQDCEKKCEIRNPKSETNPNHEGTKQMPDRFALAILDFVIRICFGFRHSDFRFVSDF